MGPGRLDAKIRREPHVGEGVVGGGATHPGGRRAKHARGLVAGPPSSAGLQRRQMARMWPVMSAVIACSLALAGLMSLSIPRPVIGIVAVLAAVTPSLAALIDRFEPQLARMPNARKLAALGLIGLPMLLFGLALALWASDSATLAWHNAVALMAAVSLMATAVLHARLVPVLVAQIGLWIGASAVAGSGKSMVVIAMACVGAGALAVRQGKMAREEQAERSRQMRIQHRAEEILSDYEQTGQGWFWETDRRGLLTYVSPTIAMLVDCGGESLIGRPLTDLFVLDEGGQEGERTLAFHLSARSSFQDLAVRAATSGDERWCSISGRPLHDHFNNFLGFRGSGSDLTEKRRSAADASRLAMYDSLTSLANRFQMSQTLEKILNAKREEHRLCAVFLLDLDRFKQVNDTLGHPAGDALLKQVAQRLERAVDTTGRVGRLGGDEFQIILPGMHRQSDLEPLARRVIESISQPYSIYGHRVVIGASIGIAIAPRDGVTSEAIIRNADLALYAAKDGGRGRHHFYAPDLHSEAEERRQLEQDLRDALVNGGLQLYYQPVVHTATERITGFEALLRWEHPKHGWLSPAKFVPIAEDAGLIAQIGEWALRTACRDLAQWPDSVRVAVNVSPLQFANPALPAILTSALAAAQVAPARLELEITESVFLNDSSSTEDMFNALKRVGVRLALDDFGTGYSSLGYLKKAPFDKIKIDQSFVRGATIAGSRNGAIIASIVSLAEALGMETTAEGVETLDELDLVRRLGCSHVQGYIYEKAMSGADAAERLRTTLAANAMGPRSARAARQTMLRKIMLEHEGQQYNATVRNMSATGALIEGLWNVPAGTPFNVYLGDGKVVNATARWCKDDRMGVEFATPLGASKERRPVVRAATITKDPERRMAG